MSRFLQDINLSEVPELQPVPDGTLVVEVEAWEEKRSSNGNPMASICCKIIAPTEVAEKVGKYYLRIMLMNSLAWRWRQIYAAAGILELGEGGFDPDDLIGKQFGMIVTLREYEGRPSNQEQRFLPIKGTTPELRGKWEDVEAIETGAAAAGSSAAAGSGSAGVFG